MNAPAVLMVGVSVLISGMILGTLVAIVGAWRMWNDGHRPFDLAMAVVVTALAGGLGIILAATLVFIWTSRG